MLMVLETTDCGTAAQANSAAYYSATYSASLRQVFGTVRAQGIVMAVTEATAFFQ